MKSGKLDKVGKNEYLNGIVPQYIYQLTDDYLEAYFTDSIRSTSDKQWYIDQLSDDTNYKSITCGGERTVLFLNKEKIYSAFMHKFYPQQKKPKTKDDYVSRAKEMLGM